jgi:adenylate cyclase class 2
MRGHETEIKLKVRDPKALPRKLASLGFTLIDPRHFERNLLFDFPDLRLRDARSVLRLRFEGSRCLVTFKGAPLESRNYKVRREMETGVEDGRRFRAVLEALGLREVFRYEKYRTTYAPRPQSKSSSQGQVMYDEAPIGNFIELEGPKRWIDAVAHRLGFRRDEYVTDSYVRLYYAKCAAEGRRPGNMVFRARK